jgi:hypothetical protein
VITEDLPPVGDLLPPLALGPLDVLGRPGFEVTRGGGFGLCVEVGEPAIAAVEFADPFEPAAPFYDLLVVVPAYL